MIEEIQDVVECVLDGSSFSAEEDQGDAKSYDGIDALRVFFRMSEDFKKRVKRKHVEEAYQRVCSSIAETMDAFPLVAEPVK